MSRNNMVLAWKSKGLSSESVKPSAISDNSLHPVMDYFNNPEVSL